jgi:triosephosphate isomerase
MNLLTKKVVKALENGLEVVLCIGELLEEREAGNAEQVCKTQLLKDSCRRFPQNRCRG